MTQLQDAHGLPCDAADEEQQGGCSDEVRLHGHVNMKGRGYQLGHVKKFYTYLKNYFFSQYVYLAVIQIVSWQLTQSSMTTNYPEKQM